MNILKYLFSYIIGDILYFISLIFPKSKRIWVFGAWGGNEYADNPKYLFEYVTTMHPAIKAIWLTRSIKVYKVLKKRGQKVYRINSILGFWYSCRAKIGVISHGMIDLNRYACARMEIVQTWHGIPMKPILLSDPKIETLKKRNTLKKLSSLFPFLKKEINYSDSLIVCSSSEFVTDILKKTFGIKAPIEEIGFPRLDGFFIKSKQTNVTDRIEKYKNKGITPGIYMPTWRQKEEYNIIGYLTQNLTEIDRSLKNENAALFLRIHPFDQHNLPEDFSYERIHLIRNEDIEGDIYSVIGDFDFLISDYSSIIFDYLIIKKPILLLAPDRENYIESNGMFVHDYKTLNLSVYNNWYSLFENFHAVINDYNIDDLSDKYHLYKDGDSSKRLFNLIQKKLNL